MTNKADKKLKSESKEGLEEVLGINIANVKSYTAVQTNSGSFMEQTMPVMIDLVNFL